MKPNLAFTITDHHGHFVTSTGYDEQGDKVLNQLSLSTGGAMLPAKDEPRLSSLLRNIERRSITNMCR
jgi:hypothetical protein